MDGKTGEVNSCNNSHFSQYDIKRIYRSYPFPGIFYLWFLHNPLLFVSLHIQICVCLKQREKEINLKLYHRKNKLPRLRISDTKPFPHYI